LARIDGIALVDVDNLNRNSISSCHISPEFTTLVI
jgi:hypothetical protein